MLKTFTLIFVAMSLASCQATQDTASQSLQGAFAQLDQPDPNYGQLIQASDQYLLEKTTGPDVAAALYLHGRALEEKAQRDLSSPQADFANAAIYYNNALSHNPSTGLLGLIQNGIGNVLYFQDQYGKAIGHLEQANQNLEKPNDKAWSLYRIGLCQQRSSQFEAADKTFAMVQQQYPGTTQAQRAREHAGQRQFWVQLGTYGTPTAADAVIAELKKQNITATRFSVNAAPVGPQYVRVGPMVDFAAAASMKQKLWAKYPGVTVLP